MESTPTNCDLILSALRRIIRAIDLHSKSIVQSCGLTGPQVIILKELSLTGELPVGKLAKRVNLSHATTTDILDRLSRIGVVRKQRSESDKRCMLVTMTDKGKIMLKEAPSLLQERFVNEFEKLMDWEQSLLISSIQRIASMMEARELEARPVLVSGPLAASADETLEFLSSEDASAKIPTVEEDDGIESPGVKSTK